MCAGLLFPQMPSLPSSPVTHQSQPSGQRGSEGSTRPWGQVHASFPISHQSSTYQVRKERWSSWDGKEWDGIPLPPPTATSPPGREWHPDMGAPQDSPIHHQPGGCWVQQHLCTPPAPLHPLQMQQEPGVRLQQHCHSQGVFPAGSVPESSSGDTLCLSPCQLCWMSSLSTHPPHVP